jgi:hypothetical protein
MTENEKELITIAGRAIEILSVRNIKDWAKRLQSQLDLVLRKIEIKEEKNSLYERRK